MTDAINGLTPGTPLTEEQKKALADSNAKESAEAHRLASEQIKRDIEEGRGTGSVVAVADMIKQKLERGEVHPPEDGVRSKTRE